MNKISHRRFTLNFTDAALTVLLTCFVLAATATSAKANDGQLDPSFASNGIFLDNFNGSTGAASVVAVQSDGKIVAAGQLGQSTQSRAVIIRLNKNGSLDNTFGSGGAVTVRLGDCAHEITGMAIQNGGKIVVSGLAEFGDPKLFRLNSNGTFDTSFGNSGFVDLGALRPGPFVLQPDGKILLIGESFNPSSSLVPEMQRFNNNGQLDKTFGSGGSALLVFSGNAIALQPDGKILITSTGFSGAGTLVRYNSNGTLDTTLGTFGQVAALAAPGLAVQPNGGIVTEGTIATEASSNGNSTGFGLMRFDASGAIDPTFGTHGAAFAAFPDLPAAAAGPLVIQSNGDIVVAGSAATQGSTPGGSFALARFLGTGQLDNTFGDEGIVTTNLGAGAVPSIAALAIQTDGKIVAAGTDGAGNLVVARYLGK
ncbi:MAG: hypothetical protein JOY62_09130 [Acidobacteriaceae bacterium]|nr:hypothetical protein [Acidobacteriaceae bacterium]MBV9780121.1 hypothetical protein [Acidobacteriaceae bacterium]